jgi:ABC-type amino acid transport substrate-binding protein
MKNFLVAFLLIAGFCFSAQAKDVPSAYDAIIAKNEIVCGITPWAPYKEIDVKTNEWKGFAIDIYRKAFATLDMKVTFKEVIVGNQIQDLNSGRVDAICDDGPYTMSAGKFVEFSDPAYASPAYPYVRIDDNRFKSRKDLNDGKITFTGIDGDLSVDLVNRLFPSAKTMTMPGTTDMSQLFLNVATKKADVTIVDPAAFSAFEKNNPGKLKPLFKDKPLGVYKIGISVRKGDVKTLGLVNQAIDNAIAFGIVDEILEGFDPKNEKLLRVRSRYEF